jgi:transcription initiation factor TFIIIB Brf1 subunit/transcription initiation factor TFIIB
MCYSSGGSSDVSVVKEREAMGKEFVYCHKCGFLIREKEFARGLAHTVDHRHFCTRCRPLATPTLPVNDSDSQYVQTLPRSRTRTA